MSDPGQGGIFVYHPLNAQHPLYAVYAGATGRRRASAGTRSLPADDRERLQKRYRLHMRDVVEKRGLDPEAALRPDLKEDGRALVRRFRAFFPALLEKTTLTGKAGEVEIFFPVIDCFDNRCVEIKGHGEGVFITSRTLDVIELFANTLAMCVRLNALELRAMLGFEDPPPPHVLMVWMTMISGAPAIFMPDGVEDPRFSKIGARAMREELYVKDVSKWLPEAQQRGWSHYRLSLGLTWLMLRAVHRLVRGNSRGGEYCLGVTSAPAPEDSALSLDGGYLATLILSFIVLHEISHLALGHNMAEGPPVDPQIQTIVERSMEHAAEHGAEAFNLVGTAQGHETGADVFALEVIGEEYREPVMEAATLWCAALAGTNADRGDWVKGAFANPLGYPGYAMRVWFINGRLSSGMRQGPIAQDITRQAEALASALSQQQHSVAHLELFGTLWKVAAREVAPRFLPALLDRLPGFLSRWRR